MNRETALRLAKFQAVTSGGVAYVNGKELTSRGGYWYLDGEKVTDVDGEVLDFVEVDEGFVRQLMAEDNKLEEEQ